MKVEGIYSLFEFPDLSVELLAFMNEWHKSVQALIKSLLEKPQP